MSAVVKRFANAQRVWVRRDHEGHSVNAMGTVERLRRADDGAWITLDKRLEGAAAALVHPFPVGDNRERNVLAYPDDCDPEYLHAAPSA